MAESYVFLLVLIFGLLWLVWLWHQHGWRWLNRLIVGADGFPNAIGSACQRWQRG